MKKRQVVIIGAGASGMTAAIMAARQRERTERFIFFIGIASQKENIKDPPASKNALRTHSFTV